MNKSIVMDTHILLWSLLAPEKLNDDIKQSIIAAQENDELYISSISLWEIAMLKSKRRVNIYEPTKDFLCSIADIPSLSIQDISPEIAAESVQLIDDFHGDPADRIIVATSKCLGATLITRDSKILDWAKLGHIKSIQA